MQVPRLERGKVTSFDVDRLITPVVVLGVQLRCVQNGT